MKTIQFIAALLMAATAARAELKTMVDLDVGEVVVEIDNIREDITIQTGLGYPPSNCKTEGQRYVWGINEARANAVVKASQALGKLNVASESQLDKMRLSRQKIESSFKHLLRGAQEYKIGRDGEDGPFRTEIVLPLTSVNQMIMPTVRQEAEKVKHPEEYVEWEEIEYVSEPTPVPGSVSTPAPASPPKSPPGPEEDFSSYTGIIIDARHLAVETALAPRILTENDRVVYDVTRADRAHDRGMVGYIDRPDHPAIRDRTGPQPLFIRAEWVQEKIDLIVSVEDAGRIVHADQFTNILAECRVAFVLSGSTRITD